MRFFAWNSEGFIDRPNGYRLRIPERSHHSCIVGKSKSAAHPLRHGEKGCMLRENAWDHYILVSELVQILPHQPGSHANPCQILRHVSHQVNDRGYALAPLFGHHQSVHNGSGKIDSHRLHTGKNPSMIIRRNNHSPVRIVSDKPMNILALWPWTAPASHPSHKPPTR